MSKSDQQSKDQAAAAPTPSELEALKTFVHKEVADTATHAALIRLIDHVAGLKGKA